MHARKKISGHFLCNEGTLYLIMKRHNKEGLGFYIKESREKIRR
jgi:hypothetical protein